MFGLGWYEILLIAIVAVVIVGPKDLPMVLRTVFGLSRKAQAITREFRRGIDDLAKETGLEEVKKDLQSVGKGNIGGLGEKFFDDNELKRQLTIKDPTDTPSAEPAPATKAKPKPAPDPAPDPAQTPVAQSASAPDTDDRG